MSISHAPIELLNLVSGKKTPAPRKASEAGNVVTLSPQVGSRNQAMASFAGSLVRRGGSPAEVEAACLAYNATFDQPLSEDEAKGVAKSISRYEPSAELTEQAMAGFFASRFDRLLRFVPGTGWMAFDGKVWARDAEGLQPQELSMELLSELKVSIEAKDLETELKKKLLGRVTALQKRGPINNIARFAASSPLLVDHDAWDDDANVLNFQNGTIYLPSLQLRSHSGADRLTQILPYDYNSTANCPQFMSVLEHALGAEEAAFLLRILGHALTGIGGMQKMVMAIGSGRNGKSTITEAVSHAMGPYARSADPSTFAKPHFDRSATNDLARLSKARLVTVSEWAPGRQLDSALLKRMLGDEKMPARFLYQENIEFVFKALPIVSTNYLPVFDGADFGIARRLLVLTFPNTIEEGKVDPDLSRKLRLEAPGIMNRLLQGALEFSKIGLQIPESVRRDTDAAVGAADQVGLFLADRCEESGRVGAADLYNAYRVWMSSEGGKTPMGDKHFRETLIRKNFSQQRGRQGQYWLGLSVKRLS